MSKINISFNNKNYNIDESTLSSASSDLQSHLSTTMKGSGAMINFNGTSYNIDSTKLSNATNDFVSYLVTIVGNGHKIKVSGVEYNVDSTKLASAISKLETVLGNLGSDDSDNLNEYGFYFEKKYSNIEDGVKCSYVFHENGSFDFYYDSELVASTPEGTFMYEKNKAIATDGSDELSFYSNGTKFDVYEKDEMTGELTGKKITYVLEEQASENNELNQYGFYYGVPYQSEITNLDGVDVRMVFTFYKNGDANMKIEGVDGTIYTEELASNGCKYEQDKIILLTDSGNDELMISNNGKTLSGADMVLSLDESYNLALNEYGFYFNTRYSYADDDTYFHVTFYEDGHTMTVYDFTPSGGNVHNYMGTWLINANGELEVQFDNNSNSIKTVNISNNGETLSWVLEDSSVENTVVNLEK